MLKALTVLLPTVALVWPLNVTTSRTAQADYSSEPFVIEHSVDKVVVDADGTQTRDTDIRIRVQSPAGLQAVGTVIVPYSRELTTVDIRYVRSRKPDGTAVDTPAAAAIDLPADMTRLAPMYTDLYLKQINVRGLAVGDTLEYAVRLRTRSLIPGQFWLDAQWADGAIVLSQDFEVSIPVAVEATVKTADEPQPAVELSKGLRTYHWHRANLKRLSGKETAVRQYDRGTRPADVQITTFRSWADVGAAVRELWRDRALVTPEIRGKALDLTRGLKTNEDKVAAIYSFVSTKIRYVAVSFGIGRIQPHTAGEVLGNGFGDCKDKHTLLAALLSALGITAELALIGPGAPFDQDVPTVSQFSHVITAVLNGNTWMWLDTTLEVAPLGLLLNEERDQNVLLVPTNGAARLTKTPSTPSRASVWRTESVGAINEAGTLEATIHEVISGDPEVTVRAAFRSVPQAQWIDLAKKLPLVERFNGSVSGLVISSPEDTTTPFQITYLYTDDAFSEWPKKQIIAAMPFVILPSAPDVDAPAVPMYLGGPVEFVFTSRITLPSGYEPALGTNVEPDVVLDESFARYRLQNLLKARVFETHRETLFKKKEIAVSEFDAYRKFVVAVDDAPYYVDLRTIGPWTWDDTPSIDWYGGVGVTARKTMEAAVRASRQGNHQQALTMLQDLARANPKIEKAWVMLAWTQSNAGRQDQGIDTLRRRIAEVPSITAYKLLGSWLDSTSRAAETVDLWRDGWRRFGSDDGEFALYLGQTLIALRQYGEAVSVLQTQLKQQAGSSRFHWTIGRALLGDGQREAGVSALRHAVELDSTPYVLNNVAWEFAERGIALDEALLFANRAVKGIEEEAAKLTLTKVDAAALGVMSRLGMYWDTLAWTHFRLGHLDDAERYQLAAWDLMIESIYAAHLAEIYKARNDTEKSTKYNTLARLLQNQVTEAESRALNDADRDAASRTLEALRQTFTISVPRQPNAVGSGQVYVLSGSNGQIVDLKFIDGDPSLQPQIEALRGLALPSRIPPLTSAKLLRRGGLTCGAGTTTCKFVLFPARMAASMQ